MTDMDNDIPFRIFPAAGGALSREEGGGQQQNFQASKQQPEIFIGWPMRPPCLRGLQA
eukprot:CAMPEP_0204419032 /NCGR_PEP_ID=MMETSP0470-20130426/30658_1 /ASSEMBLY_ACC=CAM_ASM_000385 /TAXON_ID=2969 /ORGANISM="Oxyrrhis marina" /LENGTH=57 /DNA_ID=CAMNT_0051415841 /DNA_START=22 /DNA_END=195 /DNA_ORIENTATION=-